MLRRSFSVLLAFSFVLALSAAGCGGSDSANVELRVVSDLVPELEVGTATAVLYEGVATANASGLGSVERNVVSGEPLARGLWLATFEGVPYGTYTVWTTLRRQNGEVLGRQPITFTVSADASYTVTITADCVGVECPGGGGAALLACVAGVCVDPRCSQETPEFCPTDQDLFCEGDGECTAQMPCGVAKCEAGACLQVPSASECGDGEFCSALSGCTSEERPPEAPEDPVGPCGDACALLEQPCAYAFIVCENAEGCTAFSNRPEGSPCPNGGVCDADGVCIEGVRGDAGVVDADGGTTADMGDAVDASFSDGGASAGDGGGCDDGYAMTPDGECVDVDECASGNGGCDSLVSCTNTAGGFECGACPSGYVGRGDDRCIDIDDCAYRVCDPRTTCTNAPGGFTCSACPDGFDGTGETGCEVARSCAESPCDPRTTCSEVEGGVECSACPEGYVGTGANGCFDVDECTYNVCDLRTTCTNTDGGFECGACPAGFVGSGESGCVDVNECAIDNGGCDALARCVNTAGGFVCGACPSGFVGDGYSGCADINECDSAPCEVGYVCENEAGSFSCTACPDGQTSDGSAAPCVDLGPPTIVVERSDVSNAYCAVRPPATVRVLNSAGSLLTDFDECLRVDHPERGAFSTCLVGGVGSFDLDLSSSNSITVSYDPDFVGETDPYFAGDRPDAVSVNVTVDPQPVGPPATARDIGARRVAMVSTNALVAAHGYVYAIANDNSDGRSRLYRVSATTAEPVTDFANIGPVFVADDTVYVSASGPSGDGLYASTGGAFSEVRSEGQRLRVAYASYDLRTQSSTAAITVGDAVFFTACRGNSGCTDGVFRLQDGVVTRVAAFDSIGGAHSMRLGVGGLARDRLIIAGQNGSTVYVVGVDASGEATAPAPLTSSSGIWSAYVIEGGLALPSSLSDGSIYLFDGTTPSLVAPPSGVTWSQYSWYYNHSAIAGTNAILTNSRRAYFVNAGVAVATELPCDSNQAPPIAQGGKLFCAANSGTYYGVYEATAAGLGARVREGQNGAAHLGDSAYVFPGWGTSGTIRRIDAAGTVSDTGLTVRGGLFADDVTFEGQGAIYFPAQASDDGREEINAFDGTTVTRLARLTPGAHEYMYDHSLVRRAVRLGSAHYFAWNSRLGIDLVRRTSAEAQVVDFPATVGRVNTAIFGGGMGATRHGMVYMAAGVSGLESHSLVLDGSRGLVVAASASSLEGFRTEPDRQTLWSLELGDSSYVAVRGLSATSSGTAWGANSLWRIHDGALTPVPDGNLAYLDSPVVEWSGGVAFTSSDAQSVTWTDGDTSTTLSLDPAAADCTSTEVAGRAGDDLLVRCERNAGGWSVLRVSPSFTATEFAFSAGIYFYSSVHTDSGWWVFAGGPVSMDPDAETRPYMLHRFDGESFSTYCESIVNPEQDSPYLRSTRDRSLPVVLRAGDDLLVPFYRANGIEFARQSVTGGACSWVTVPDGFNANESMVQWSVTFRGDLYMSTSARSDYAWPDGVVPPARMFRYAAGHWVPTEVTFGVGVDGGLYGAKVIGDRLYVNAADENGSARVVAWDGTAAQALASARCSQGVGGGQIFDIRGAPTWATGSTVWTWDGTEVSAIASTSGRTVRGMVASPLDGTLVILTVDYVGGRISHNIAELWTAPAP